MIVGDPETGRITPGKSPFIRRTFNAPEGRTQRRFTLLVLFTAALNERIGLDLTIAKFPGDWPDGGQAAEDGNTENRLDCLA